MPGRIAFARFIDDWQLVNDALKPLLGRYPHLAEEAEDLEKLIASARDLSTKQERLRAELQQTTHLRLDAEAYGKKLRSRVLAQVKGKLGFESDDSWPSASPRAASAARTGRRGRRRRRRWRAASRSASVPAREGRGSLTIESSRGASPRAGRGLAPFVLGCLAGC